MASRDNNKELQEFVKVRLWAEDSSKILQALYGELLPSNDEFRRMALKQLEEALKPRPTVRPIIKRRRRFQLSSIGQDTSSGATVVPSSESGPSNAPGTSSVVGVVPSSEPASNNAPDTSSVDTVIPTSEYNNVPYTSSGVTAEPNSMSRSENAPDTSSVVTIVPRLESESSNAPRSSSVLPADSSSSSGSSNAPVTSTHSTADIPPACSTHTARKSTTGGKVVKVRSNMNKKVDCSVSLINLRVSNLSKFVKPLLRQFKKQLAKREEKMKSTSKIQARKDSTDSGVALDDDDCLVMPQVRTSRIEKEVEPVSASCATRTEQVRTEKRVDKPSPSTSTVRNEPEMRVDEPSTTTTTNTFKPSPSTSYKAKKRKIDAIPKGPSPTKVSSKESFSLKSPKYSKTGGDIPAGKKGKAKVLKKSKPSTEEKEPTKQLPSVKVSIPWDDELRRIVLPDKNRRYFIKNRLQHTDDNNNKTILPKDVVPSVEFDVNTIRMSPLSRKRNEEPVRIQYLPPYAGPPFVCVSCNISFPYELELKRHTLSKHSSSCNF